MISTTMISTIVVCCLLRAWPVAGEGVLDTLAMSSAYFSQQLYQQIALDKSNIVYSPFSIQSVFGLLHLGASGDTADEILNLVFNSLDYPVHEDFKQRLLLWNKLTEVRLYNANGVFVNPSFPVQRQYVDSAWKYYFAQSANIDFSHPEGPEKPINEFVERQTKGFIKEILPAGTINGLTALVLVNTIFFNGTWQDQFDPSYTRKRDFYTLDGDKIQVDMMYSLRRINLLRNVYDADILELPYHDNFALYIALPHEINGITQLESVLNRPSAFYALFHGFRLEYRALYLPKFTIEADLNLKEPLKQMGIRAAFSSHADLTGISKVGGLYVSEVFHKAVIEVQESGTVAAAATAVMGMTRSQPPPPFKVDHPFIFFLIDRQTHVVLFQGKYSG